MEKLPAGMPQNPAGLHKDIIFEADRVVLLDYYAHDTPINPYLQQQHTRIKSLNIIPNELFKSHSQTK